MSLLTLQSASLKQSLPHENPKPYPIAPAPTHLLQTQVELLLPQCQPPSSYLDKLPINQFLNRAVLFDVVATIQLIVDTDCTY